MRGLEFEWEGVYSNLSFYVRGASATNDIAVSFGSSSPKVHNQL